MMHNSSYTEAADIKSLSSFIEESSRVPDYISESNNIGWSSNINNPPLFESSSFNITTQNDNWILTETMQNITTESSSTISRSVASSVFPSSSQAFVSPPSIIDIPISSIPESSSISISSDVLSSAISVSQTSSSSYSSLISSYSTIQSTSSSSISENEISSSSRISPGLLSSVPSITTSFSSGISSSVSPTSSLQQIAEQSSNSSLAENDLLSSSLTILSSVLSSSVLLHNSGVSSSSFTDNFSSTLTNSSNSLAILSSISESSLINTITDLPSSSVLLSPNNSESSIKVSSASSSSSRRKASTYTTPSRIPFSNSSEWYTPLPTPSISSSTNDTSSLLSELALIGISSSSSSSSSSQFYTSSTSSSSLVSSSENYSSSQPTTIEPITSTISSSYSDLSNDGEILSSTLGKSVYYSYIQTFDITASTTTFETALPIVTAFNLKDSYTFSKPSSIITTDLHFYKDWLSGALDSNEENGNKSKNAGTIAGSVVGSVVGLLVCTLIVWYFYIRKRRRNQKWKSFEVPSRSKDVEYNNNDNPFNNEFDFQHRVPPPLPPQRKNHNSIGVPPSSMGLSNTRSADYHMRFSYISSSTDSSDDYSDSMQSALHIGSDSGRERSNDVPEMGYLREII
ncbi:Topoisomerase I damage affected protein 7 [Nakaseomyces glabratus]|nr:Topoisomerase I damage affected protein 7 [Nakaseomyces glabratus]KTB20099.1 Topoisomerase I damage affected protein 7 [Nakaseomyces glabratus]